jgi:CheY-like chemotaxis protein
MATNTLPVRAGTTETTRAAGRLRVLVVDDAADLLELICTLLETEYQLHVVGRACDGTEALAMVAELQPDLVLSDISMPKMDGLALTAMITQHFPAVTVVLMSGDDSTDIRAEGAACGAHAFIQKAKLSRELASTLKGVCLSGSAGNA